MLTDVGLLPVYNKLYELNLDEVDIEKTTKKVESLEETKFSYNFLANETLVRTFPKRKYWRTKDVELIPFNSVTGEVTEVKEEDKKFTNDILVKNVPCYTIEENQKIFILKEDVLKFSKLDKQMIPEAAKVIEELYPKIETMIIDDIEQIKEVLRNLWKNSFFATSYIENHTHEVKAIELVNWVFDTKMTAYNQPVRLRDSLDFISQIVDVGTKDNTRVALSKRGTDGYYDNDEMSIIIADEKQACYNYLDIGRQFYINKNSIPHITGMRYSTERTNNTSKFPKLFLLNEEVKAAQKEKVFQDILTRNVGKGAFLVDALTMETVIRRYQRKDEVDEQKEELKETLKTKFKDRLNTLDDETKELKINGIKLKKYSIEYEGQLLKTDAFKIKTLLTGYANYRGLDELNFDTLSTDFFEKLTSKIMYSYESKTIKGKIGEVDYTIENKVSTNKVGSSTRLVYINGCRVKKDEIGQILNRGLCFEKQEAFDNFVKQVSKCSLQLHKYLSEGIQLRVRDDYKNKNINFKIPLVRKKNLNFIVIGDKEYRVSNTGRLIRLEDAQYVHEVINTLLNPDIAKIDGPDDIAYIITKGEELHEKDKEKNRKLINKVENLFNIEVTEITHDGNRLRGYVINGKISNYFLDIGKTNKETIFDRLRVYSYPDMQYVCMIDKTVQQTGPSNLINRIFALHNDSLVAREVDTLNQQTN